MTDVALSSIGGMTIRICSDGRQVIRELEQFRPQLILLDTQMPVLDGPSTLLALREVRKSQRLPVAFMTADQNVIRFWPSLFPDITGVISKPFDPLTLSDQLRCLYDNALAQT